MADPFNPYHIWLGIPPQEQPANHYRLLSIQLFEASADAIDNAADRQMAHLRTIQTGKYGDLTQRLLNEVSAARVCLLDPKKRAAYDQQLRAKLAATTAVAPAANDPAAGGSAIQRQPPRRATTDAPAAMPTAAPLNAPVAAAPQSADSWNDLLGDPNAKPASRPGGNAAKAAAAKRSANNRMIPLAIVGGILLVAIVGFVALSSGGASEGTLVFDWPASDRANTTVKVDGTPLAIPASGPWEFSCPPGSHHIVADHLAYKLDAKVDAAAGQKQTVAPDWKAKATLVLNWPLALRSGAELRIDGHVQTVSPREPLEVAVEPGPHKIQITRSGFDPIHTTATVAADARELVSIAAPPTTAKLAFDWPAADRKDAELIVDGHSQKLAADADSAPIELTLPPGRHVVHIARAGYEPFNQAIDLAAGAESSIKPTWTPEQKAAPMVAEAQTPVETVAQPAKKLAVPAAAEQERIAKQLESLYRISKPDAKDAAKAQELYDVAAKDGSTPAERYMLLLKGAEVAAVAGDLNLSLSGIDALDADFEINALDLKQKLLEKFINAGKPDQVAIAIPAAEQLVDQAVAADQYEIALVLATTASHAATKAKIADRKEIEERLSHRRRDIHVIEPLYAAAKKAQETLDKNPADGEANLAVGRWDCLYKGDWTNGLPLLAKGSNEKLKSLAADELKAPTDAEQQAHLADGWWDMAQNEAGTARDSIHLHAGSIYQGAMPNLPSALRKAAIEQRLTEIANVTPIPVVASQTMSKAAGPVSFLPGQWVDVLRLIDPARDSVSGAWSRQRGQIVVGPGIASQISIPVTVDGAYDFLVEFTRSDGKGDVDSLLSIGSHKFLAGVSCFDGGASGIANVDGRDPGDHNNPTAIRPGQIENGRRYRILTRARITSEHRASVDVMLDGKPYLPHWEGDPASLSENSNWPMPKSMHLGLGAHNSAVIFHAARLRMVSGHAVALAATVDSGPSKAAPAGVTGGAAALNGQVNIPLNRWVDILGLVDPGRDTVAGQWSRDGAGISSDRQPRARIEIPVTIDGAYDLEVEFTRAEGAADANTIIPVGSEQCDIMMSAWNGKASGIGQIDGHAPEHDDNPASIRPGNLENGRRYKLLISVGRPKPNRASIDVSLDGREYFPHWEGEIASLGLDAEWWMPHSSRPALATFDSRVTYHAVRLRMKSGRAAVDLGAATFPKRATMPTIMSARYGVDDAWDDITADVRKTVARGEVVYAIAAKHDPAPGRKKILRINYSVAGKTQTHEIEQLGAWSRCEYDKH